MKEKFVQKAVELNPDESTGKLKVEKLWELMEDHPYKEKMYAEFEIDKIKNEIITIDFIDIIYKRIKYFITNYKRKSIKAEIKHISVFEEMLVIDGEKKKEIVFQFDEYVVVDEVKENLKTVAKYDSKNTYLDEYVMTKYANSLFENGLSGLARQNIQYFKDLASSSDNYNKHRSYRLVENEGVTYLRGITSTNKYYEYGVDFAFVSSMLAFHDFMKKNSGVEYKINSAHINESKLEIIVDERFKKDAGEFGKVSTAIKVSTNDLGKGSLNFLNIINIGKDNKDGFYLFPKENRFESNRVKISHTTKPENVFATLKSMQNILNTSDRFIKELKEVKTIKTPDELRMKIQAKIDGPRSSFGHIKRLSDIFKTKIDNEITNLSTLLEMCNKAEELEIEFDLKDRLRYIISDIILYGNAK
ncbi:hypothetical protein [Flavobacterium xinjiangense]|uniref:Uncharacterized protein n=1 Tax=Flavobacterium xinjiangense TaxID=178356 RepID=A0A1M7PSS7_9FLAO|nr:hypothetical protein [Flavobacterium xinjiangense]SHN20424.1 hypothetical protein SAMN05216269_12212 [Flavobacterium xinjiangense]